MSRSGYTDDCWDDDDGQWRMIRWRGAVKSALRGKRGQAFLRECLAALDALPDKRLVSSSFQRADGEVCVLGAVAKHRNRLSSIHAISLYEDDDPDWGPRDVSEDVAAVLDIPRALAAEIMYENDESGSTPESRFGYVRRWIESQLIEWDDAK